MSSSITLGRILIPCLFDLIHGCDMGTAGSHWYGSHKATTLVQVQISTKNRVRSSEKLGGTSRRISVPILTLHAFKFVQGLHLNRWMV